MPSLRDVQHAVRRSLLQDADGEAAALIVGAGLVPRQRLNVYRNTILAALGNALRLSFSAVHALVGAELFGGAAQIFAREQPPRCVDLNAYGADFPDFLQRFEPAATLAYLPDDLDSGPVRLMVHRLAGEVEVVRLDEGAWRFAAALFGGQPLGSALDAAQGMAAPELLAHHQMAGHCIAFHIADGEALP